MKLSVIKIVSVAVLTFVIIFSLTACKKAPQTDTQPNTAPTAATSDQTAPSSEPTEPVPSIPEETQIILGEDMAESYDKLCSYLKQYPKLELLNTGASTLAAEQYISLCAVNPDVKVVSKVLFEGSILNLSQSEIDLSGKVISDKAAFEALLSSLPDGIKIVMCDCGYTNEEMGALREKYPTLEFAWRIYMGKWTLRTDDEAFSVMIYDNNYVRLTSQDIEVLKYCTNMYALDLGHQELTDLSVIGDMTQLRVLILADNKITDISPLANLKHLQYLELFVNRITDLSPLASCTELVDLNFGWNPVYDFSCIYSLDKIDRLWLPNTKVSPSNYANISEVFSQAKIVFHDVNSISSGWRTHDRYFVMRDMFTNNKYAPDFVKND